MTNKSFVFYSDDGTIISVASEPEEIFSIRVANGERVLEVTEIVPFEKYKVNLQTLTLEPLPPDPQQADQQPDVHSLTINAINFNPDVNPE